MEAKNLHFFINKNIFMFITKQENKKNKNLIIN